MKTIEIKPGLFQFTSFVEPINLSFNQFLLDGTEPVLIHAGTVDHARMLLPLLQQVLGSRSPAYVFISHFESDECGGLGLLLRQYPDVKPVCSAVTARQLSGFGISDRALIQVPGKELETCDGRFEFIAYPSEMHLWEGLLLFEKKRSVLFSSDLFMQFGKFEGGVVSSDWKTLVSGITADKIPSPAGLEKMQAALSGLPVALVAPGHGPCIEV